MPPRTKQCIRRSMYKSEEEFQKARPVHKPKNGKGKSKAKKKKQMQRDSQKVLTIANDRLLRVVATECLLGNKMSNFFFWGGHTEEEEDKPPFCDHIQLCSKDCLVARAERVGVLGCTLGLVPVDFNPFAVPGSQVNSCGVRSTGHLWVSGTLVQNDPHVQWGVGDS